MVLLDFETELILVGIILGLTFGLIGGFPREEKIREIAISTFGTIIAAFAGINFYVYGYSLQVLLKFLTWSCGSFIFTFILGRHLRLRKRRGLVAVVPSPFSITPLEEIEIRRNAPEVDAELMVIRSILFGYKVEILLKLHNVSDVVLDRLCASLEISDLKLKEKKKQSYDLPNLLPNEKREFTIIERIGRSLNHTVDLQISRKGVKLAELHWTLKTPKNT